MERSEWDDDDLGNSPSPVPAHERTWRHPSEMAAHARAMPTGPMVDASWLSGRSGRGVSVVAGALGLVIAVGLLRLLLPPDGPDAAPVDLTPAAISSAATLDTSTAPAATITDTPTTSLATTSEPTTNPTVTTEPLARPVPFFEDQPDMIGFEGLSAVAVPLSADGFLMTTASAVNGRGSRFEVVMPDGQRRGATLVATGSGLAVLRLDVNDINIEPVRLADADVRPEGIWVTVFGERPSRAVLVATDNGFALAGLGPSEELLEGAPVVDDTGRVVGLCSRALGATTLVLTHTANDVKASAREQAWLGIAGTPETPPDTPAPEGVLVVDVVPGSPAAIAGLLPGDDITSVDGKAVISIVQLAEMIAAAAPDDEVVLRVVREEFELEFRVVLGARPYST